MLSTLKIRCMFVLCCCVLLRGFTAHASTITVANQLASHYSFDPFSSVEDCPSGYTVSGIASGYHIERPHAVYNSTTGEWVLWAHYDNSSYTTAEALVATSSSECGPYTIYNEFQPLGYQVRDDFLFEDTDGTAYFIAASNKDGGANDTMAIWRLSSDYLSVDSSAGTTWLFEGDYREAPIAFKSGSEYYLLTSQAAGWYPSQGGYASSSSMLSGWGALTNMGNSSTFGGQGANIKIINGTSQTSYILVLDHLGGTIGYDDGALYLPLSVDSSAGTLTLEWLPNYQVDTVTGIITQPTRTDLATTATTGSSIGSGCHSYYATDSSYTTSWCASSATWPAWWKVDLGLVQSIGTIDISWYMYKGSEGYYQYKIMYSNDGSTYTTIDRSGNRMYGFTSDMVNISARYLEIYLVDAVLHNNTTNWYTPRIYEVKVFAPETTAVSVTNSSFESPTVSDYTAVPSGATWTFSGTAGISANSGTYTSGNSTAPAGSQVAYIEETGSFSQAIGGFTIGKTYVITFSASQRQNLSQSAETIAVQVNGTTIANRAPYQSASQYNDYSATFVATATTNTIGFVGTNTAGGDNTVLIDNVRIWTPAL